MRLDSIRSPTRRREPTKPTFGQRIRAWWDGYDLIEGRATVREIPLGEKPYVTPDKELRLPLLAECLNQIWGVGFTGPGNGAYCCDMVRALPLNETHSMLDLGAGLGGPARAIAKEYGIRVEGLESDPVLAEAGMMLSNDLGVSRKAPIALVDPAALDLPAESYHCVFSKDYLHRVPDRQPVATQVAAATKPGGHLLVTTFTVAEGAGEDGALADWRAGEPTPPTALTLTAEETLWRDSGYTVRQIEDISETVVGEVKRVFTGWQEIVERIASYRAKRALLQELVGIVKLWTLRVAALESGALRVHRLHAVRRVED